jgi:hypothetical protein
MERRNNILKEEVVLLIVVALFLSTIVVTANTVKVQGQENDLVGIEVLDEEQPSFLGQFDGVWLQYDTGKPQWRWGAFQPYEQHSAIVLTPEMLSPYDGWSVKEIAFCHYAEPGSKPHNTEVIIYDSDNTISPEATLITEAFVANDTGWQYFILSEPVLVDASKYLWVSVKVYHAQNEYPFYADATVSYPGLSDKYYYPVYEWQNLSDYGYNHSWLLRARVSLEPDLDCEGDLRWDKVVTGSIVTGNFIIKNSGDSGTKLNWTINNYINWGSDWTFTPSNGTELTPEDGPVTIEVSFVAPPDKNKKFTGIIKAINLGDPNDFCEIDVYLKTPRNRESQNTLLQMMFERFSNAFPILRHLLRS